VTRGRPEAGGEEAAHRTERPKALQEAAMHNELETPIRPELGPGRVEGWLGVAAAIAVAVLLALLFAARQPPAEAASATPAHRVAR